MVSCNSSQLIVASGCDVYYVEILEGSLFLKTSQTLEYEVACLDVSLFDEKSTKAEIVAVGLWTDISVCLLKLPTLEVIHTVKLGGGEF